MSVAQTLPVPIDGLEERISTWEVRAAEVEIRSQAEYDGAAVLLRDVKALLDEIDAACKPQIRKAHELHRALVGQHKGFRAPLESAENTIKGKISAWVSEQERRAREEAALEEAVAREARERAEREAAQLREAGEHELADAVEDEGLAVTPAAPLPPPRAEGVSTREVWRAEVTDLRALVQGIAAGQVPLSAVTADTKVLAQQARSLGSELRWPGVRVWSERVVVARGRRAQGAHS